MKNVYIVNECLSSAKNGIGTYLNELLYCLQAIKQFVQIGADAVFSRTQAFIDYIDVLHYSSIWQRLDLPITDS